MNKELSFKRKFTKRALGLSFLALIISVACAIFIFKYAAQVELALIKYLCYGFGGLIILLGLLIIVYLRKENKRLEAAEWDVAKERLNENIEGQFTAIDTLLAANEADNEKEQKRLRRVKRIGKFSKFMGKLFIYLFLVLVAVAVLFPFYWMLISSVKSLEEYRLANPTFWPKAIHLENYIEAFRTANLGSLFLNTLYVGLCSTLLSLVITILSAFAFARLEFKGRDMVFGFLLATMMIPGELFTITNYATVYAFKWQNTFTALIVPFLVSVFYIYLLRQNFKQIPNELYLAAKVDGTSDFMYLLKVMIPLALPQLISITILKMMGAWNSYIWPRLVANDAAHRLITNGLRNSFTATTGDVNYPVQMAAVAIVSAPLFLVFIFLRKYIMKGVSRSGIKG